MLSNNIIEEKIKPNKNNKKGKKSVKIGWVPSKPITVEYDEESSKTITMEYDQENNQTMVHEVYGEKCEVRCMLPQPKHLFKQQIASLIEKYRDKDKYIKWQFEERNGQTMLVFYALDKEKRKQNIYLMTEIEQKELDATGLAKLQKEMEDKYPSLDIEISSPDKHEGKFHYNINGVPKPPLPPKVINKIFKVDQITDEERHYIVREHAEKHPGMYITISDFIDESDGGFLYTITATPRIKYFQLHTSNQRFDTGTLRPSTGNQRPRTSNQRPSTSNQRFNTGAHHTSNQRFDTGTQHSTHHVKPQATVIRHIYCDKDMSFEEKKKCAWDEYKSGNYSGFFVKCSDGVLQEDGRFLFKLTSEVKSPKHQVKSPKKTF